MATLRSLRCAPLLLGAALLLSGCPGDTSQDPDGDATPKPRVSGSVVLVTTLAPALSDALHQELRSRVRGLDLSVETVTDDALTGRVAAGGVDLVLSRRTAPVESLAAGGLLLPLPEQLVGRVPEGRVGVGGRWLAIGLRARVITTRRMLANKPRYVTDLSEARFRGRTACTDPTDDGFVAGVATLMADRARGIPRAFLAGLLANCGELVLPDDAATVAAVADRRADLALVDHTAFFTRVLGDSAGGPLAGRAVAEASIEAILPDADGTGAGWSATGAGVVAGAPNSEAAFVLLEVLLSPGVQTAWSTISLEYPAVEGVPAAPGLPAAESVRWSRTSLAEIAANRLGAVELIERRGEPLPVESDDDDSAEEPSAVPE